MPFFFPKIGASKQFLGAFHRRLGDVTTHDLSNLAHTLLWTQFIDNGDGTVLKDFLADVVVCIGKCSDLWQVRYADYLVVVCEHPQLLAHNLPTASTDARIDLVKDECRGGICRRKYRLQRKHEARGLAAGGNFGKRLKRLARVGRDQE